ncbi:hypothetical protein LTR53_000719 [Teratosphaeriaceae sp. CCFEE 6253]|nr:hypothetical protein LTR53_000719 [Teratosphaeriaceae sp. CCFEE 6253]
MLPEEATKFGVYEMSKRMFARCEGVDDTAKISVWAQTASGGLGGVTAQFVAYPIDTLRFRMRCEMKRGGVSSLRLMRQVASKTWAEGGVRAYFRGLGWGLVGQYPYSAIDLTFFEYAKRWWIDSEHSQSGAFGRYYMGGI